MSVRHARFLSVARISLVLATVLLASGCASMPGRTTNYDPYERFNRKVDKFNDAFDRAVLKPVATGYKKVTPRFVRTGVTNFFANLQYPTTCVNQFLQGKFVLGLKDTGRFLVNSTLGIGGLFDVATKMNLPAHDEDFGQTLAMWGVHAGPYIVLPFFGPSNLRDGPSRLPDIYTDALHYLDISSEVRWGLRGLDVVNQRVELMGAEQTLSTAYDRYTFLRDAWVQRREYKIFDGEPPIEDLEDEPLDDPAMEQDAGTDTSVPAPAEPENAAPMTDTTEQPAP